MSLNETLNELSWYANISGLNVNFEKTKVIWIGKNKYSSKSIKTRWKLSWGCEHFKLLGIKFDVNLDKIVNSNYAEKITKIQNLLKLWKRRYLTPVGKITVIKTLLLPILNHLFISLPDPNEDIFKHLNTIFFEFVWQGPAKIKKEVIIKQYCEGGLQMINIKAFVQGLKISWIKRLINKTSQ